MRMPDMPIAKVTPAKLSDAVGEVAPATYNRVATVVLAAARLSAHTHQSAVPLLRARPVRERRLRFLSPEQYQTLDAELPPFLRAAVAFSLATGLRQSNVFDLTWQQVNLAAQTVLIYADEAKAGKRLILPLSSWALEVLAAQRGKHETLVFPNSVGKRIGNCWITFHRALQRAGIEDFRWHDLRHTWASWAAQAGVSMLELQHLGGWASLDMVQRYAHLSPSHLQAAANRVARPAIVLNLVEAQKRHKPF
jgi:integrase